jgi:hydroxypyruvate reductase 1
LVVDIKGVYMETHAWRVENPHGRRRVLVTKELPGKRWREILIAADCRIEIGSGQAPLEAVAIQAAMGTGCHGVIGQLTEPWGEALFGALAAAGGRVYSNYAVGYNNVDLAAASRLGILVGNTPGVLTEATAEMAVALTFAAARRVGEAERFLRSGHFQGWLPGLFLGRLLWRKTVGVIGAGRIGEAYAQMMVQGHKMNLIYHSLGPNRHLEESVAAYNRFLVNQGEVPLFCRRAERLRQLLQAADVVSLHTILDATTRHLLDARRLALMKPTAILVNTSRGPVIDEVALVRHCRRHPDFRVGLDVFEDEPALAPGLADLDNVVIVPHIASATRWTREGMAILAASNVAAVLMGWPAWGRPDLSTFLAENNPPPAAPSLINAKDLNIPRYEP